MVRMATSCNGRNTRSVEEKRKGKSRCKTRGVPRSADAEAPELGSSTDGEDRLEIGGTGKRLEFGSGTEGEVGSIASVGGGHKGSNFHAGDNRMDGSEMFLFLPKNLKEERDRPVKEIERTKDQQAPT